MLFRDGISYKPKFWIPLDIVFCRCLHIHLAGERGKLCYLHMRVERLPGDEEMHDVRRPFYYGVDPGIS